MGTKLPTSSVQETDRPEEKRHKIVDCPNCKNDDDRQVLYDMVRSRRDGPANNTRSQTNGRRSQNRTSGRLSTATALTDASINTILQDEDATFATVTRCDDGSDDCIACPSVAEAAALQGIGRIKKIKTVRIKVAFERDGTSPEFTFSCRWCVPDVILNMKAGKLANRNVSFLICDDRLVSEPLIIGRPVLLHLRIDTNSLLKERIDLLDGTDCAKVGNPVLGKGGYVSRLISNRNNKEYRATVRPSVSYNRARLQKDPFPDPALLDLTTDESEHERKRAIEGMITRAKDAGLPRQYHRKLEKAVQENNAIFQITLAAGPPARLVINLTPDAKQTRAKLRNYSPSQSDFLKRFVDDLVGKGQAYANPSSRWASAPLLVPKSEPPQWRFTVDLRAVNKFTEKSAYPMPNLEHELHKLARSKFYANFDLSHAYWQLELDHSSQECQSFITPHGVFTPTRVLHGISNAVAHLQSAIQANFQGDILSNFLNWLDDILLHAATEEEIFAVIVKFLAKCRELNLFRHPNKCELFARLVRWCGRQISPSGIKFDTHRLDGLLAMSPPTTAAHLQQFLCAMQWMRMAIPSFQEIISPLHIIMEHAYGVAGKRTRRATAKVSLKDIGWSDVHLGAFNRCKEALANQCKLRHRDDSKRLCLFTDASDVIWSGIVTQVPPADLKLPFEQQKHELLAFLSGRFDSTQLGWAIIEKEAYAVLASCERMRWMLATPQGFKMYTDHNNLIFIFDPLRYLPDMSASSARKVLRWAVTLSWLNYLCYHISGEDNVWADLLGRWSAPPTMRRLISIPVLTSASDEEFEWPSEAEIVRVQSAHAEHRPPNATGSNGLYTMTCGSVWIPEQAEGLQLRICIIAHTSAAGRRGAHATESAVRKEFLVEHCQNRCEGFCARLPALYLHNDGKPRPATIWTGFPRSKTQRVTTV